MKKQNWAFFDFDDTLFRGDSILVWNRFLYKKHPTLRIYGVFHLCLIPFVALGILPKMLFKRLLHLPAGTFSQKERLALGRQFVYEEVPKYLYPEVQRRLRAHKDDSCKVAILSASAEFYLPQLASSLDADFFKGTPMHFKNDRGSIWNPPYFGEINFKGMRKVEFLSENALFGAHVRPIASYSDHHSDIPLLEYANLGIAVNPNKKLQIAARKKGWEVLTPISATPKWKQKLKKLRLFLIGWI